MALRRFTDEQIERANRIDVVEYARSQGYVLEKSGSWYRAKHTGGLYFHQDKNTWHWQTHDVGGRGAISLCMEVENKTWVEAVKTLIGEEMETIRHSADWQPEPDVPKEFHLPDKNDTYRHVFAYLTKSREIDSGIVKTMVDNGYIYENTQRSCVFVGKDSEGVPRHASVRSTNTYGKTFKQDVAGSQKEFSFSVSGTSGTLNVFEAPIDALSYMSLQKAYGKQMQDTYLSLGGVTMKALDRYLEDHGNIEKIRICTDNDPYLNPVWNTEENAETMPSRIMNIEKVNRVKELDDVILFRTNADYSQFYQGKKEINYVAFPKEDLTFSEEDGLYRIEVSVDQEYTLYKFADDLDKGIGTQVNGQQLYNHHFFKMPAGERAALSIYEKYGKDYKVTRHRPTHKDFNEDLVAHREKEQGEKQAKEQQPDQKQQDQQQETVASEPEDFFIKGKCEDLIICDNKQEIEAFQDFQVRVYKTEFEDDIEPNEYYLAYRDVEQVRAFVEENPEIKRIWACTSRTVEGTQNARDVLQAFGDKMECHRKAPKLDRFTEDVQEMKRMEISLQDTPLEELPQMDMAAGLEM